MSKTIVHAVDVQFGDCDPAGIVFFPNFSRWMDAASHHYFMQCGLPPWRAMEQLPDCVGAPLLEIHTRFMRPATYGDTLQVHTSIETWNAKTIVQKHVVMNGDVVLCEGRETRAFCIHPEGGRLQAIPVPDFIRDQCG